MKKILLICLLLLSMMTMVACGSTKEEVVVEVKETTEEMAETPATTEEEAYPADADAIETDATETVVESESDSATEGYPVDEMTAAAVSYGVNIEESSVTWSGSKVGGSHYGPINIKSGTLGIEGNTLLAGEFVVDMTSIDNSDLTGGQKDKLIGHLKSDDFFGVETYPEAKLVIKSATDNGDSSYSVVADLTIKETTEEVLFDAVIVENSAERVEATAEIKFDRAVYDIRYGSPSFFDDLGDKVINDEVALTVTLVANK